MGSFASFGEFSGRYFCYVIAIVASYALWYYSLFFILGQNDKADNNDNINILFLLFLSYLGHLLSFFLGLIIKYVFKKNNNSSKNESLNRAHTFIKYIFNDPLKKKISFKGILSFIVICLFSLISNLLSFLVMIEKEKNEQNHSFIKESHSFEYIFFLLMSVYFFKNNYYKHQYFSIIILSILGIIEYIIYISFFKKLDMRLIFTKFICFIYYTYFIFFNLY
jgi:hypothetical protein